MGNPLATPRQWDYATIAGVDTPGMCKMEGCPIEYKWESKEAKDSDGATNTFINRGIRKPKMTLTMWQDEQFLEQGELFAVLKQSPDSKSPVPLTIDHPACRAAGIDSVVVESIGDLTKTPDGLCTIVIQFIEDRKPTPKTTGTAGSPIGVEGYINDVAGAIADGFADVASWF
jgi:hypothetical protein